MQRNCEAKKFAMRVWKKNVVYGENQAASNKNVMFHNSDWQSLLCNLPHQPLAPTYFFCQFTHPIFPFMWKRKKVPLGCGFLLDILGKSPTITLFFLLSINISLNLYLPHSHREICPIVPRYQALVNLLQNWKILLLMEFRKCPSKMWNKV